MNKLRDLRKSFSLKVQKLSEKELSFLTGGLQSTLASSGTSSGSSSFGRETGCCKCCDATTVHCCPNPKE